MRELTVNPLDSWTVKRSDRYTVLNCPSVQCCNGSTRHTIELAHGVRVFTCVRCGSIKRQPVKR